MSDESVIVMIQGIADPGDRDWIIDTVVEGCDAAGCLDATLVVDARFAHLDGLTDAGGLFDEIRHMCAKAGVEPGLRRTEAPFRRDVSSSRSPGRRSTLGLS